MSIAQNNFGLLSKQIANATDDTVVGDGIHFERIRRITGYLVGTLDRFNDGKRAEERDRVKHVSFKVSVG